MSVTLIEAAAEAQQLVFLLGLGLPRPFLRQAEQSIQ
jgi:hypothetical protein